ncbi:HDOD domain-containing protein [Sulfuriferula nivalis]|uniref:Phosphohydrolase n=1 Tax=Sulfuriferula nivalis TaxID=2675298 RepID=A0A809RDK6_9PROT|nr:HDOD domain-containing protein [Sulfuriferula nivalis]BBO99724.1 phosphohydrolase [Sulfuriferula nivalis]
MAATDMQVVLDKLHQLPVMPLVIQEVISSFNNPDLDARYLGGKIAQDQGLTAKVLRVVNSAFYALPKKIVSMQDAVVIMGFNNVRSLVLSAAFLRAFPSAGEGYFDNYAHWKRSFRVAIYAKALAKCMKYDQEMAFTSGMFYDIGQLMMDICIHEQFDKILEQHAQSGQSLLEIEQLLLGFDHAMVGAEVVKRWNFPSEIVHVIRYWRTPDQIPFELVTAIVHVAVLIENGLRGEGLVEQLPQFSRNQFEIHWEQIEPCLPDAAQVDASVDLLLAI